MANDCPDFRGQRPGQNHSCLFCAKKHSGECAAKKNKSLQECLNCKRAGLDNRKHNTEWINCPCEEVKRYRALCKAIIESEPQWARGRNIPPNPELPFTQENGQPSVNRPLDENLEEEDVPSSAQPPPTSSRRQTASARTSQRATGKRKGKQPVTDTTSDKLLPLGQQDYLNRGTTRQSLETEQDTPVAGSSKTSPIQIEIDDEGDSSGSDRFPDLGSSQSTALSGQAASSQSSVFTTFSPPSSQRWLSKGQVEGSALPSTTPSSPAVVPETRENTPTVQKRKRAAEQANQIDTARVSEDESGDLITERVPDQQPAPRRRRIFRRTDEPLTAAPVLITPVSMQKAAAVPGTTKKPKKPVAAVASSSSSPSSSPSSVVAAARARHRAKKLLPLKSTDDRDMSLPPMSRSPTPIPERPDSPYEGDGTLTDGSMDEGGNSEGSAEETDYSNTASLFEGF